jgi:REP element-mobilizing transposase RayT
MIWSKGKFFRSVGNVSFKTIQEYITQSQGEWTFGEA